MDDPFLRLSQEALLLTVLMSAPAVLGALIVGLVLALVQALTQVQEQTLQMAAKILTVFGILYVSGYWIASLVYRFALTIFQGFGTWVG